MDKKELKKILNKKCNLSDIKDICFDLDIDYDNIAGESKSGKIRELIMYMNKKEDLYLLEEVINEKFPPKDAKPKNIIPDEEEVKVMRLIAKNKLDDALELLIKVVPKDTSLFDQLIILLRRLTEVNQQIVRGIIDERDSSMELNKITDAILKILKKD